MNGSNCASPKVDFGSLALFGAEPHIDITSHPAFRWPIMTDEDEAAAVRIIRRPDYFDESEVSCFEEEYAEWCGTRYAVAHSCGTAAILAALWACGVRAGDEVIAPSSTYWATVLPIFNLGGTVVFADIDPKTLNMDPNDIMARVTPRTKAIIVVHQLGYPVDMDPIMEFARARGIKVIEDASHAHGTLYKGRKAGTLGDVAAFSLCGKPISAGEGGMLVTDNQDIYEGVIAFAHNFRFHSDNVHKPSLLKYARLPLGGVTTRMHNLSAAIGRVQLRRYDERMAEIQAAMNYFWDQMAGMQGLIAHRPSAASGSTMGGWYCPHGLFDSVKFGGLSVARFIEAIRAEGYPAQTRICLKEPLHLHPLLQDCDVYGHGKPTRIAFSQCDVRLGDRTLKHTESVSSFTVPAFKKFDAPLIRRYVGCFEKVAKNFSLLLAGDRGNESVRVDNRGNG